MDPSGSSCPAGRVAELAIDGHYQSEDRIYDLATVSDLMTVEIEHVNAVALEGLRDKGDYYNVNMIFFDLIKFYCQVIISSLPQKL